MVRVIVTHGFVERLILLVIGSYLTYYFGSKMMKEITALELNSGDSSNIQSILQNDLKKTLNLNIHEKSILNDVVMKDQLSVGLDDIIGLEHSKNLLRKCLIGPLHKNKGLDFLPNGIIFHGPPGTGKTMLAKALANELDTTFINFSIASIENKLFGESAKLLKALFTVAEKLKPCIVFIDELDGFAGPRNLLDQTHVTGLKTQLLLHMDGLLGRDGSVIFIGATNMLHNIDPAVKRRMRLHVRVDLPTAEDITKLIEKTVKVRSSKIGIECECRNFSCSDVAELCKLAQLECLSKNKTKVNVKDVQLALEEF